MNTEAGDDSFTIAAGAGAFGDGNHPTTAGMLAALEAIDPAEFTPGIACDMGAGSGILSLAIARRFHCLVIAVDLERSAVETLRQNTEANGLDGKIIAIHSDGFRHAEITARAPYDLIVMNILAEPLLGLAADAVAMLATGGVLLLSGILVWQEAQITAAYQLLGLELATRLTLKDWVTLCWQKP